MNTYFRLSVRSHNCHCHHCHLKSLPYLSYLMIQRSEGRHVRERLNRDRVTYFVTYRNEYIFTVICEILLLSQTQSLPISPPITPASTALSYDLETHGVKYVGSNRNQSENTYSVTYKKEHKKLVSCKISRLSLDPDQ